MNLSIISYDPAGAWRETASTAGELLSRHKPQGISWINVDGLDGSGVKTAGFAGGGEKRKWLLGEAEYC
jgi:hypothetical protein